MLTTEERGRTTIADRAVERLAAHAVTEVTKVRAHVTGDTASLEVRLSITYPLSVARATEQARAHLMRRIAELTGLTVSRVDITVTALYSDATTRRRVQ